MKVAVDVPPRLHVVLGKGGVGKSTLAASLALAAAHRGARVLAIELGEVGGTCRILDATPPHAGAIARAADGTNVAYFDGAAALAEYLVDRVHLGRLARRVMEHPLYTAFVDAAPGLRELMAIGKVRDELILKNRWDVVIVDAGASGHALEHLRMPAAAAATFSGRVHREAAANAALLRDRSICSIHVVTLPEVMPVREAAHTVQVLRSLDLATGAVFANRCWARAPDGAAAAIARVEPPELAALLRRVLGWSRIQERAIADLELELAQGVLRLPRIHSTSELTRCRTLARHLVEVA